MRAFRSVSRHKPLFNPLPVRFTNFRSVPSHRFSTFSGAVPDQKLQNLFWGFLVGVAFTSLYNREFPGYERRLRRKAGKGDAQSLVEYGHLLLNKDDDSPSERNTARAFQCFQSASEQGHKAAHYYLGILHKMEKIEAPNPKAAFHHFTVAANDHDENDEKGHGKKTINDTLKRQSQFEVAQCHLEGYGADRDISRGLEMLEQIGKDNGDAAYLLSQIYANGRYGVMVNTDRALSWKRESAKLGNKQGTAEMHEMYVAKGREIVDKEVPDIGAYDGVKAA